MNRVAASIDASSLKPRDARSILWCHEVDYRDKPVYEYQDFAERLAGRGHRVEVIDFNEKIAGSPDRAVSRTGEGTVAVTPIRHCGVPVLKFAEARYRYRSMLAKRLAEGSVDAAVVYSVFINGTQTLDLCRRAGVPVICRVLDAYHRLRPSPLAQALLKRGERHLYRHSDRILVTNEQMAEYVETIAGSPLAHRIDVLNHGVDTSHFRPVARCDALAEQLGIPKGATVALFLGTTYAFSGLEALIDRLPHLIARCPDLHLLVLGAGEADASLRAATARSPVGDRIHLAGMVSYDHLREHLSLGTIALNPFEINDITRDIIPIKLLQYLACGLPVLSTPLPDVQRKFPNGRSGIGYSVSDAPDDFAHALVNQLSDPVGLELQGRDGLRYVSEHFSVTRAIDRLETTLLSLTTGRP